MTVKLAVLLKLIILELCCITQRGVSVVWPSLADINGVDRIVETPFRITLTAPPETAASRTITQFKQHVSKTVSTNTHEGRIHYRTVVLDCVVSSKVYLIYWQLSV